MKKLSLTLLLGLSLVSCVNNDKDLTDSSATTTAKATSELQVPADFTWETMQMVQLNITSPVDATISVYSDEACTNKLVQVPAAAGVVSKVQVTVPDASKNVYIQYPISEKENKVVAVALTSKANSPATRGETEPEVYSVGEDALLGIYSFKAADDKTYDLTHYTTSGTVMFEDNWPYLGDYDLNDVVVDYNIDGYISQGNYYDKSSGYERLEVALTIRAIGGYLPNKIGFTLALPSTAKSYAMLKQSDIAKYAGLDEKQGNLSVTLANPSQSSATPIFYVNNIRSLVNPTYFNTTKKDGDAVTVKFVIYPKATYNNWTLNNKVLASFSALSQDIFMVTSAGREIHMRGYMPTSLYTNYATDASVNKNLSKSITYATADNHVWGVKIPAGYAYPKETIDAKDAFTGFASWITSGGVNNQDWYKYPVLGMIFEK